MLQAWHTFLQDNNVSLSPSTQGVYEATNTNSIISDMSQFVVITVTGSDAASFLQRQLTNYVPDVNEGHHQLTGWCSAKGRMLVSMRFCHHSNGYCLLLPRDSVEAILKRLRMFVFRDDVQFIEDNNLLALGFSGQESADFLENYFNTSLPETADTAVTVENTQLLAVTGASPRYIAITESEEAKKLWLAATEAGITAMNSGAWDVLEIKNGIPHIVPDISESFVPQMVNFDLINGVSFTRANGCYPGQEIVARMHYLGAPKRRMYLAEITTTQCPVAGDTISNTETEENVGTVVNAQHYTASSCIALVVMKITEKESEQLSLTQDKQASIHWQALPYEVVTEKKES